MSVTRRIARTPECLGNHARGFAADARRSARELVHPLIDRLLTDAELHAARYRMPAKVARSRAKSREWTRRIEQRLAVPEHVRLAFGGQ